MGSENLIFVQSSYCSNHCTCLFLLGVLVGHYLQSVSKNADLGAELAYQYGPQVPGGEIAVLSLAGRYSGNLLLLTLILKL